MEIVSFRRHKGCLLIAFKDLLNINLVERYKGCVLSIDAEDLSELDEDEAYFFQLVGCQVVDEKGEQLGEVCEIIETAAHDTLRVKMSSQKDLLIPYVDAFILEVDLDEKRIVVRLIEGML